MDKELNIYNIKQITVKVIRLVNTVLKTYKFTFNDTKEGFYISIYVKHISDAPYLWVASLDIMILTCNYSLKDTIKELSERLNLGVRDIDISKAIDSYLKMRKNNELF